MFGSITSESDQSDSLTKNSTRELEIPQNPDEKVQMIWPWDEMIDFRWNDVVLKLMYHSRIKIYVMQEDVQ